MKEFRCQVTTRMLFGSRYEAMTDESDRVQQRCCCEDVGTVICGDQDAAPALTCTHVTD